MNEHGYIRSVHRHLHPDIYKWKINDNFAGGVADAWYCGRNGLHLFVEFKYLPKIPKRETTMIVPALSATQTLWLKQRHEQGIPVAVVHGSPVGGVVYMNGSWETGLEQGDFIASAMKPKDVASFINRAVMDQMPFSGDKSHARLEQFRDY